MKICPKCHRENPDMNTYCGTCGAHLTKCPKCGTAFPAGNAFCGVCGTPLSGRAASPTYINPAPAASSAPPPTGWYTPSPGTATDSNQDYGQIFRSGWRALVTSPLALALIICYSVAQLLSFVEINSSFNQLGQALSAFGVDWLEKGSAIRLLIQLVVLAPGALITIGMWMLYADAQQQSSRHIKTSGFSLMIGACTGVIVLYSLLAVLFLFGSCSAMEKLGGYGRVQSQFSKYILIGLIVLAFGIIMQAVEMSMLKSMREAVQYCKPNTAYAKGYAIYLFISIGLNVITLLMNGLSISGVLGVANMAMCAAMLLRYRDTMESLWHAKTYPQKTVQNDPVQAKQPSASAGEWKCTCGRINKHYISTCTCGMNKRQVVKQ